MFKQSFTPDKLWYKDLLKGSGELGAVVFGIMASEFTELLQSSPQRSGSYVASFRLAVDGMCDGPTVIDTEKSAKLWFYKGAEDAIQSALSKLSGGRETAMSISSGMSAPVVALVNDIPYAEDANAQEGREPGKYWEGDPGNPSTSYHVESYEAEVRAKLSQRIYVGMSTWNFYRDFDI